MRVFLLAFLLGLAPPLLAQTATVAEGSHVNLRAGKTDAYRILRVLPPGTRVEILEQEGQVARVRIASGETGWLPARFLTLEPPGTQPAARPSAQPPAQPSAGPPAVPAPAPAAPSAPPHSEASDTSWLLAGALGFLIGAGVGIALHEAYYRKRLNGLRI